MRKNSPGLETHGQGRTGFQSASFPPIFYVSIQSAKYVSVFSKPIVIFYLFYLFYIYPNRINVSLFIYLFIYLFI